MTIDERARALTSSEKEWLRTRRYLAAHRFALGVSAAGSHPPAARVAGTPLLAGPGWLPRAPLDLAEIDLRLDPDLPFAGVTGREQPAAAALPTRADGTGHPSYAAAVAALAAPAVFADLSTYRLAHADLSGPRGRLEFGLGTYFDSVDVGEACAHEYTAHFLRGGEQPLRAAVGDPWDLARRPANLAVSTLTLRHDRATGTATFLLHRRDPAKVGHAGGLTQVVPVGVFQPSGPGPWNTENDFDLWRSMTREFAEELRGEPDRDGESGPIDYGAWPLAAGLASARADGGIRVCVVGLGTDPLTFATDLLTVAVFDAEVFDDLLGDHVADNEEGTVIATLGGGDQRIVFDDATIDHLLHAEPMQAAGAALLALAWRHRDAILG